MSGIYVHIPFCKKACHYCNFHFSTNMSLKTDLVKSIVAETTIQKGYLKDDKIRTIYFGGGTPSVLSYQELASILDAIRSKFSVLEGAEITLEANPDDLSKQKLSELKAIGVNRLSIGIQSFYDDDLEWMNRSHNAQQAFECVKYAQDIGLENISIDLIFGSPTSSDAKWIENLNQANSLNVPHISCYGLTVEPNTALEKMIEKGKKQAPSDALYAEQFSHTMEVLTKMGYTHYEISNYAKDGLISQHNTNYWRQQKYLGLGPAAHSFNGKSRQWNVNHNLKYIKGVESGSLAKEEETLKPHDIFNEYIMTGLRTMWGCNKEKLVVLGKQAYLEQDFLIKGYVHDGTIIETDKSIVLTNKGKLIADHVISSLFINEPA